MSFWFQFFLGFFGLFLIIFVLMASGLVILSRLGLAPKPFSDWEALKADAKHDFDQLRKWIARK